MSRWFTILLYALMLACAALPLHAAAVAWTPAAAEASAPAESSDAESPDASAHRGPGTEVADPDASSNDSNTPELPELFFATLPRLALLVPTAQVPSSMAAPLRPHPCLKGPQRPPRATA